MAKNIDDELHEAFPLITSSSSTSYYESCENNKILSSGKLGTDDSKTLRRNMKFHHCFAFVVGCIVGAGIFITPSLVAQYTPNLFVALLAWTLAGGIALLGALCYCEMVSVVNKTGASYIFILDCYGKAAGFIVNWTNALIFAPCDACILLITIGLYACAPFFEDHNSVEYLWCAKLVGGACMIVIAGVNCLGAKKSGIFQIIFISIQVILFLVVIIMSIYAAVHDGTYQNLLPETSFNNTISSFKKDFPAFSIALFNALYCFDGYSTIAYLVEEAVEPSRTIPLVTFTSIPFVTFIYVLINVACASVLTHSEMASSKIVISDVIVKVGGKNFIYLLPFMVTVCVIPALSAVFYNLPRLIMSSAREGQFPSMFSLIHKERRTPVPAILFLAFITGLLTLCNLSLQTMLQCCNISIWFEYAFAISTILVNRWKRPELKRTYKTWITTPIIMMIVPIVLFVLSFNEKPISSVIILIAMSLSVPVYYVFLHKRWFQSSLPNATISLWLTERLPLVKCEFEGEHVD
ncbi:Y+L amino acid transporter 2-like [Clytia hemisphaerica]